MVPFFSYLQYKDSNFQQDDGFITGIQVSGGALPMTVTVSGPNGYTAGPFVTPTPIPALTSLEPGVYTLTVLAQDGETDFINITIAELPETVLTAVIPDPCDCAGCNCELTVSSYIHNSNCFTYELYLDGNLIDTYTACAGSEAHIFTGLCNGQYSIVATENDSLIYTYNNPGGCSEGVITFDENSDIADIVANWARWCFLANSTLINPLTVALPTGLDPVTGIISNAPGTYFERGVAWDLGDFNIPMVEGDNVGPAVAGAGNYRQYYYNTAINKYIVNNEVAGGAPTTYWWDTFDPRVNTGLPTGFPTATHYLTTTSNWGIVPLGASQYTIDATNTVVLGSVKSAFPSMIQCTRNSAFFNGFYSVCKFDDYIHEVTIGSTNGDDDEIGIVLAGFYDVNGLHGPVGVTHTLSLVFTQRPFQQNMQIVYNIGQNSYGFWDGATAYSASVIQAPGLNPFGGAGGYSNKGYVRIKIEKVGNIITIYATQSMGIAAQAAVGPGGSNPYNPTPIFSFDLLDKNTWTNAPAYAVGNELAKFVTDVKIGYTTASQPQTQFFDIAFEGFQVTDTSEIQDVEGAIDIVDIEGCPCYIATDCDDPSNQILVSFDPGVIPDLNFTYNFVEYPGKCWTIEETNDCNTETVYVNTGLIGPQTVGVYNDVDANWNVISVPAGGTSTTPVSPFPARVSDQTWDGGYGTITGAAWINKGGTPNNSGNIPHEITQGVTVYELNFTPPPAFIPLMNLEILTDNYGKIYLNGNLIFDNTAGISGWTNPPATVAVTTGFVIGVNTLIVEIQGGTPQLDTNGFALAGSISNANPPAELVTIDQQYDDCDDCTILPNICWDLEVVCDGPCDDIYALSTPFDFTPYIGQNISIVPPITTDPECWYTPHALRQAIFVAAPQTSGGGYNLDWPSGQFQMGLDNITISIPSFIYNGVEQITGPVPSTLMTPANIQFVECVVMTCNNVPLNNPTGHTGYANTIDLINTTLASLGILSMQAFNNDPNNCPLIIPSGGKLVTGQSFRFQYRDGDTFALTVTYANIGQGTNTILYEVQNGNVTITVLNGNVNVDQPIPTCNDNIYCLTDPADSPVISSVVVEGPCPPIPPLPLGEPCELTPRLGEPGFSVKNCNPDEVIAVKTKFADSVYALFKRMRYGIATCCEFDLDKIDIKNQLIDLGAIYDPDLCIDGEPMPDGCCLQPCNAVAELLVPMYITCPAPTAPVTAIVVPGPVIVECGAPTNTDGNPKPVRARVYVLGDSCLTVELLAINNGSPSTYVATACDTSPINENLIVGQPPVILCVDPTQTITNNNVQATYTGLCV